MYDENERNERHDQDVDYTEGAYSDSAYEEKNNDTAKKEETSDYGGYHDSRYRGSPDGEPEAAAGADPKTTADSLLSRKRMQRSSRNAAIFRKNGVAGDMALRILVRKLRHL